MEHNQSYQAQIQVRDGTTLLLTVDEMIRGGLCLVAPHYYVGFAPATADDVRRGFTRPAESKPEDQANAQSDFGGCAVGSCVIA